MKNDRGINFAILEGIRGITAAYVVINHARGNLYVGGRVLLQEAPISDWSFLIFFI